MSNLDLAADLLKAARAAGADAADAMVVENHSVSIGVSGGALEEAERSEAREAGLRALVGQRQAAVAASDLSPGSLARMAERAVALAREAPDDPWIGLAEPEQIAGGVDATALDMEDPAPLPGPADLEALALRTEEAALAVAGITQVEQAHGSTDRTSMAIAATNGFSGSYVRTATGVGASAVAGDGLGRERDYAGEYRRHQADLPTPEEIGDLAGLRAAERLSPRKPKGGAVPVLFDERVASSLVGHLVSAINGSAIARGASWLIDAMDRQILPQNVDLIEEPLRPRALSSRPFDAEGIASVVRPLVEGGILRRWVLDLGTARKLGLETTGNARRGLAGPPGPGVTNLKLASSAAKPRADMVRDIGTGLIVTSMIGASINPTTGAYSRGASGFWVENGEFAYPVNEITIAGSLPEMLRSIVLADDANPARAHIVPSILVEGLTVGA
ncbi:MAG: TldD/PmbA family protein [Pseudomonadota bacterium]